MFFLGFSQDLACPEKNKRVKTVYPFGRTNPLHLFVGF